MSATVRELYGALGQLIELGYGDVELRFAYQRSYPLSDKVDGFWFDEDKSDDLDMIYIVSGGQDYDNPYAPRAAFESPCLEF